jgi:hypothetical protein
LRAEVRWKPLGALRYTAEEIIVNTLLGVAGPAARLCLSIAFEELGSILGMVSERGPKLGQRFRSACSEPRVMEPTQDIEHGALT